MNRSDEWLASRLERLQRVSTDLTRATSAGEALDLVILHLDPAGASTTRGIWLHRPEAGVLELAVHAGMPPTSSRAFERIPVEADVPVAVAHRERRTIETATRQQSEEDFEGLRGVERITESFAAIPLVIEGTSLGAMSLGYGRQPPPEEILFLEAMAGQVAQTLVRLRLAERERRRRAELEFLASVTEAALGAADHMELMQNVASAAVPTLGDWCAIHYLPEDGSPPDVALAHVDPARVTWARELRARYPYDPDSVTGVAAVIRSGVTELVSARDADTIDEAIARSSVDPVEARAILDSLALTSVITVPLRTKHRLVGAMQFVSAESGREYDEDDVALAEVVAGRLSEPLDSAWVNDRHREIAAVLQRSLLPPRLPVVPGVDLAVRYLPAGPSAVGGDFYDVFRVRDDTWAVLIGDCCGTGPNAAALSSIARHTVRAAARHDLGHEDVVDWLNQAINLSDRDLFCTACYATLTRIAAGSWMLHSAAAGHPLPIVSRADSTGSVGRPGTLLGVFEAAPVRVEATPLRPGDVVVFYTDGVTDLAPPFGITDEELAELVHRLGDAGSAGELADRIEGSILGRVSESHRVDDIALVVLRIEDT